MNGEEDRATAEVAQRHARAQLQLGQAAQAGTFGNTVGGLINPPDPETLDRWRREQKTAADESEKRYAAEREAERAEHRRGQAVTVRTAALEAALRVNPQGPSRDVLADAASFEVFLIGASNETAQ